MTIAKLGTSRVTTDPAPTKLYCPRVCPHTMVALAPMLAPRITTVSRYSSRREMWERGFNTLVNTEEGPQKTSSSSITPV
jgi:hypothetical protein